MIALTRNEILTELKKLGFNNPSELNAFSKEYIAYFTSLYLHKAAPQKQSASN